MNSVDCALLFFFKLKIDEKIEETKLLTYNKVSYALKNQRKFLFYFPIEFSMFNV